MEHAHEGFVGRSNAERGLFPSIVILSSRETEQPNRPSSPLAYPFLQHHGQSWPLHSLSPDAQDLLRDVAISRFGPDDQTNKWYWESEAQNDRPSSSNGAAAITDTSSKPGLGCLAPTFADLESRPFNCLWPGCEKRYRRLQHLNAHIETRGHGFRESLRTGRFAGHAQRWQRSDHKLMSNPLEPLQQMMPRGTIGSSPTPPADSSSCHAHGAL